jgi:hypothetical protein
VGGWGGVGLGWVRADGEVGGLQGGGGGGRGLPLKSNQEEMARLNCREAFHTVQTFLWPFYRFLA